MRHFLFAMVPLIAAGALACVAPADANNPEPESQAIDAAICLSDGDCSSRCDAFVQLAEMPVRPPMFKRSRCELAALVTSKPMPGMAPGMVPDVEPAPSCLCMEGDSEENAFLLSPTGPDACLAYGRDRTCLYHKRSFPGCDLKAPETSCKDVCLEVQRRVEIDAVRTPNVRVRTESCAETGCRCVLDINGSCYVDDWLDTYDCSRSDADIIRMFESELAK